MRKYIVELQIGKKVIEKVFVADSLSDAYVQFEMFYGHPAPEVISIRSKDVPNSDIQMNGASQGTMPNEQNPDNQK